MTGQAESTDNASRFRKLTKKAVDEIPYSDQGQLLYRDTELKGFGLRVGAQTKTYIAEGWLRGVGKVVRVTIGAHGVFTPEEARNKARRALQMLYDGIDPNKAKAEQRARGITLKQAFDDYLRARKALKSNTVRDYKKCVETYFNDWQATPLAAITKDMIEERHVQLGKRSEAQANLSMRFLRALFNFAMEKYGGGEGGAVIVENPVMRLTRNKAWYRVARRQGYIKRHELELWMRAVLGLKNDHTTKTREVFRDYLLLVLLTGLRRWEAATLKWNDVDLRAKTLTVLDTKNREPHTLPLSDFLVELLERRHAEAAGAFVFPGDGKEGHIVEPRKQVLRVSRESGVDFRVHDLRRTFATVAESLDIPAYALKRLLNHKTSNDVTAGYIIADVERLRDPMQKVTDHILKCAGLRESAQILSLASLAAASNASAT
jgi:integrase